MASMVPLPWLCLPLLLLLPQISHAARVPVPEHKNFTQNKRQPSSIYIVHADHLAKPSHLATLDHWYTSMVATHSPRAVADPGRILYTYDTVMHGFAVELTGDEATRMSEAPGVIGVYADRRLRPLTTRSPGFLGLDPGFGAWRDTDFGDGVIIGFIDSGIWPESPSFNDEGLGPVRSSWRGTCVDAVDFNASLCNNKLVGAKSFDKADPTPRHRSGHGTHVASTAAGAEVRDAGMLTFARGTARGVAPKARVAMYKVPWNLAGIAMGIDAAAKDGVDIISISQGDNQPTPFYNYSLAIATFVAERKGIFVVLSGGNEGPQASTVTNVAPWMTTVGASTVDRMFPAILNLGDGAVLTGQSLYSMKANGTSMVPLVSISCSRSTLTPDRIMGKIVLCLDNEDGGEDEDGNSWDLSNAVAHAGGAGLVVVDDGSWSRDSIEAEAFTFPGLQLSLTAGKKLRSYIASAPYPTASFSFACETVIGENRAPMVWPESSRGPNPVVPELLKPDVVAPGTNILGAWVGDAASPIKYQLDSGTSMACPHVAGVAALIKKKHPGWTPAMIRSALMTTAGTLDNTGRAILDNGVIDGDGNTVATPFAAGAGHVRPQLAMDPGLVYGAGARDYIDFLCALNYTTEQLRRFAPDLATCTGAALPGGPAGLNYPSFVVVFDGRTDVRTLMRTVTKVSENAETYKVNVLAPEHVKVTVTPATLKFEKQYEKRSYTVEFRNQAGANMAARWEFGHIIWENQKHQVRSPVAFMWKTTKNRADVPCAYV